MLRPVAALLAAACVLAVGPVAHAQCTKDTDCKGERVCHKGECVAPTPALGVPGAPVPATQPAPAARPAPATLPAPATPPAPVPAAGPAPPPTAAPASPSAAAAPGFPLGRVYGSVTGMLKIREWSSFYDCSSDEDCSDTVGPHAGFRLEGMWAATGLLHVGGYAAYTAESNFFQLEVGATGKAGTRLGQRVWLGAALDVGLYLKAATQSVDRGFGPEKPVFRGFEIFPRVEVDVLLFRAKGLRWGLQAAFGPCLVPYRTDGAYEGWDVALVGLVGLVVGR